MTKNESPRFDFRGKGYKVALLNLFYKLFLQSICVAERIGGARGVKLMMMALIAWDTKIRQKDFPQFVRLRNTLPPEFWKGIGPAQHFRKIIRDWNEAGGAIFVYHRLGSPYWQKRFQVVGSLPDALPEWGQRPVILTFLHTGTYTVIPAFLRSRCLATAMLIGGLPPWLESAYYRKIMEDGDRSYGLVGVPHTFHRRKELREMIRFLQPGRVLVTALEGGRLSPETDRYEVDGYPFHAKKGACRIAAQTNAVVIPVSARRTDVCRFEIRFGKPLPDELLQKEDHAEATQYLISQLWPGIKENPGDLNVTTLEAMAPDLRVPRVGWL